MKIPVRIGYHKPYLPTPRCKKYRYERKEELVELNLPEAQESEIVHALNVFQNEYSVRDDGVEKPWDVIRIRVYSRTVNSETTYYREATGRDIHTGIAYDETINPFRGLAIRLEKGDRFELYNSSDNREFLINQATEYLNSFLLAGGVLYKKIMAPAWRVHVLEKQYAYNGKSKVQMDLVMAPSLNTPGPWVKEVEFPWYAKEDALAFANQEVQKVGAEKVIYAMQERAVPVSLACSPSQPVTTEDLAATEEPFTVLVVVSGGNVNEVSLITQNQPKNVEVELLDYDNAEADDTEDEMQEHYEAMTQKPGYTTYL